MAPACFLATKLEAFRGRGGADFAASHDLEDFVRVVDGRAEIVNDVKGAAAVLQDYLRLELGKLLRDERFLSSLSGHLASDAASQARLPLVRRRLASIAGVE